MSLHMKSLQYGQLWRHGLSSEPSGQSFLPSHTWLYSTHSCQSLQGLEPRRHYNGVETCFRRHGWTSHLIWPINVVRVAVTHQIPLHTLTSILTQEVTWLCTHVHTWGFIRSIRTVSFPITLLRSTDTHRYRYLRRSREWASERFLLPRAWVCWDVASPRVWLLLVC